ncbi:apolipoprotein N-acyltransferase [Luminiphilus syltensis NOR5-1B]|uniref:Apolipoprotein N-acyltransferase n=2 Tax=Luminiphilus TaxID=1341118 RepID=B8KRV5_9GAMM|nr:apolipoprotein N-acyltransferase [Luminiphilus syltensis NOR5-1B]
MPPLAGAVFTLGLEPWNLWPLIPVSAGLLCLLLHRQRTDSAGLIGWLYGFGFFGAGASWVYVSIHVHGHAAVPLAIALTLIFCVGLALLFALQAWLYRRFFQHHFLAPLLAFPGLWVLFEWSRSWLLTGFPWLYAGYGGIDSPLAHWAPISGVFGLSLVLVMLGSMGVILARARGWRPLVSLWLLLAAIGFIGGAALGNVSWTKATGEPLQVSIVQPNIPQEKKWDPRFLPSMLERFENTTASLYADSDLVLWPEAAVPAINRRGQLFLDHSAEEAARANSALVAGIASRGERGFHNSIVALGTGSGIYHKQKLVPFGEYVPLEHWLRGLIEFFDLPMSNFTSGDAQQKPLQVAALTIAPFICYEVVYPDFVAKSAIGSHLLITVSNDSWFGASIGPWQHLQMARFRALETQRPLLRGTNNGVSAIVDSRGQSRTQSGQFIEAVVSGTVQPRTGSTPFMRFGSLPVLMVSGIFVALCSQRKRRDTRRYW